MTTVISPASMSLDGCIAHADHSVGRLSGSYDGGEELVTSASPAVSFHLTPSSAAHWREWTGRLGALVVGRVQFDLAEGWQGLHPLGVPVVVVTHDPPAEPHPSAFHFVSTGVADAIALAARIAAGRDVTVAGGTIASQALGAGLLDMVAIDLVPVVLGGGRPYFTQGLDTLSLDDPTVAVSSSRVTHLVFPVRGRSAPDTTGL